MELFNPLPYFVGMALLFAIFGLSAFRVLDDPPAQGVRRVSSLDGLRGILALAVYFSHLATWRHYMNLGVWADAPSRFYTTLGHEGFSFFFMITGYLFGGKVMKEGDRLNWAKLYIGRVFRIGPLYWFAVGLMLLTVFALGNFTLRESPAVVTREVARWLVLGIGGMSDVNGYGDPWILLAGVTWTLRWEWYFYFALPLLALLRVRQLQLAACWIGVVLALYLDRVHLSPAYVALFLFGILSAYLRSARLDSLPNALRSAIALLFMAGVFAAPDPMRPMPLVMMGMAFYVLAGGCTMFGLLTTHGAQRLGNASYSIYLLQGLILALLFQFNGTTRGWANTSAAGYWAVGYIGVLALCIVASATFIVIERPGIAAGRRLVARLSTPAAGAATH